MDKLDHYLAVMTQLAPEFYDYWISDARGQNFGEESTVYGLFSCFSNYVEEKLTLGQLRNAQKIFEFIERAQSPDEPRVTAACTCFLETLMKATPDQIRPERFVPFLGTNSKQYCRSCDMFSGERTIGLWDYEAPVESASA